MINVTLDKRMSAIEEAAGSRAFLQNGIPYVFLRFDGKSFGTYTRGLEAPEDAKFTSDMDETAKFLVKKMDAVGALVVSDEISLLIKADVNGDMPFKGNAIKLSSLGASFASVKFASLRPEGDLPVFDGRAVGMHSEADVSRYVLWRRRMAYKNAVSMAVKSLLPGGHKKSMNMPTDERIELLAENGINLDEAISEGFLYGRTVKRGSRLLPVTFVDPRDNQEKTTEAMRTVIEVATCDHPGMSHEFSVKEYFGLS